MGGGRIVWYAAEVETLTSIGGVSLVALACVVVIGGLAAQGLG